MHALPVPAAFDPAIEADIDLLAVSEYTAFYGSAAAGDSVEAEALLSLAAGPILEELLGNLGVAPGTAAARRRMHLIACHDSTLIPLLQALHAFGGAARRWPAFAACIIVELYEPRAGGADAGSLIVRVLYDRVPVIVPGAASEWCPLGVFWRACARYIRKDWPHAGAMAGLEE